MRKIAVTICELPTGDAFSLPEVKLSGPPQIQTYFSHFTNFIFYLFEWKQLTTAPRPISELLNNPLSIFQIFLYVY